MDCPEGVECKTFCRLDICTDWLHDNLCWLDFVSGCESSASSASDNLDESVPPAYSVELSGKDMMIIILIVLNMIIVCGVIYQCLRTRRKVKGGKIYQVVTPESDCEMAQFRK